MTEGRDIRPLGEIGPSWLGLAQRRKGLGDEQPKAEFEN